MPKINGNEVIVDTTKTYGYDMSDLYFHTIQEVREAINDAQLALYKIMDISNGEGNELLNDLFHEVYNFFYGSKLREILPDLPTELRSYNPNLGHHTSKQVDFSDLPFLRAYTKDYCADDYCVEGYDNNLNKIA